MAVQSARSADRPIRIVALIVAAAILLLHVAAVFAVLDRPMHYDENEYLHASWLMAAGKRIYVDFFEDHPPHLFVLLQAVMPGGDPHTIDVLDWTRRARLLSALFGTTAVAMVMLFAWRATRDPAAAAVAAAMLLSSPRVWARGLSDIRAEAPTLALFWVGVVLLTWSTEGRRSQALRAGLGIGLLFFVAVWNPKWPLESAVMGIYFLWYLGRLWNAGRPLVAHALWPALVLAVLAFVPILATARFSDYILFIARLKAGTAEAFANAEWVKQSFARAPLWTTIEPQFRWGWVAGALVLVVTALCVSSIRSVWTSGERRFRLIAVALTVAALLEIRFLYPYPYVWAQYLMLLATASAVLYPVVFSAIGAMVRSLAGERPAVKLVWIFVLAALSIGLTAIVALPMLEQRAGSLMWWLCLLAILLAWTPTALAVLFAATNAETHGLPMLSAACAMGAMALLGLGPIVAAGLRPNAAWKGYWLRQADLQARTGREGTVFISPPRHPVAVFDAAYYWYSFKEAAPHAIRYRQEHPASTALPAFTFSDVPPCRIASNVRFVEAGSWAFDFDGTCRCVETAWRQRQLRPTEYVAIFETNADPRQPLSPRGMEWAAGTAPLWENLCSYRATFSDQRRFEALDARYGQ
jgi:hypothetical protein